MDPVLFDQQLREGEEHLANGRAVEAVSCLRRCIDLRPDDASARLALGQALIDTGRDAEALGQLEQAVALDSTLVRGHIRLGNVLRALSRTGEAVEAYGRALKLRPADPFILSNLGNAWLGFGGVRPGDRLLPAVAHDFSRRPGDTQQPDFCAAIRFRNQPGGDCDGSP